LYKYATLMQYQPHPPLAASSLGYHPPHPSHRCISVSCSHEDPSVPISDNNVTLWAMYWSTHLQYAMLQYMQNLYKGCYAYLYVFATASVLISCECGLHVSKCDSMCTHPHLCAPMCIVMYLCVYVCVCMCVHTGVYVRVFLSVCACVSLSMCVCCVRMYIAHIYLSRNNFGI